MRDPCRLLGSPFPINFSSLLLVHTHSSETLRPLPSILNKTLIHGPRYHTAPTSHSPRRCHGTVIPVDEDRREFRRGEIQLILVVGGNTGTRLWF